MARGEGIGISLPLLRDGAHQPLGQVGARRMRMAPGAQPTYWMGPALLRIPGSGHPDAPRISRPYDKHPRNPKCRAHCSDNPLPRPGLPTFSRSTDTGPRRIRPDPRSVSGCLPQRQMSPVFPVPGGRCRRRALPVRAMPPSSTWPCLGKSSSTSRCGIPWSRLPKDLGSEPAESIERRLPFPCVLSPFPGCPSRRSRASATTQSSPAASPVASPKQPDLTITTPPLSILTGGRSHADCCGRGRPPGIRRL
jgi:hypothetical protein